MREQATGCRVKSLADLIEGLRPGDECPWCGGGLKSEAIGPRRVDMAAGAGENGVAQAEVADVLLVCPDCGSEVCWAATGLRARTVRPLGAAA